MSLETTIRAKEDEAAALLQLLTTLYYVEIIDKPRYLELGKRILSMTAKETLETINTDSKIQGYPILDEELASIGVLLQRVTRDLIQEADDLEAAPEQIQMIRERIRQTAWYTTWKLYGNAKKTIAKILGKKIYWRTMEDPQVCPICYSYQEASPYTSETLPEYPAHVNCRCYLQFRKTD